MIVSRRRPLSPALSPGPAADEQATTTKARPDRAAREAMKQDRARDAALAMKEYEAERRAVLANTERLRALRLAKEADDAAGKSTNKVKKKGS